MEFKNLESKLKSLSTQFKEELIKDLITKKHVATGDLIESIKFTVVKTGSEKYTLDIECLKYIHYLEGGKFLKDYLTKIRKEFKKEIVPAVKKDLLKYILNK